LAAQSPAASRFGIATTGTEVVAKRRRNAVTIAVPSLAAAATLFGLIEAPFTLVTLSVTAVCFVAGAVGIAIGLHRYFSHRAFETSKAMRLVLGVLAGWSWQGPLAQWVADHRRHHRFADTPLDPHSPYWWRGEPVGSRVRRFANSHLLWMLAGDYTDPRHFARDIVSDPIAHWCHRHYWWLAASSLAVPAAVGGLLGGAPEALACLLWAGFVRVAVEQHLTWTIGSLAHTIGEKPAEAKTEARDSRVLALLVFGEGLHGFHHQHPSAALLEPARLDLSSYILRAWERWGWIWKVRRAS